MCQVSVYRIDVRLCEIFKTLAYSAQEKWYLRFEPKIFGLRAPMLCHWATETLQRASSLLGAYVTLV